MRSPQLVSDVMTHTVVAIGHDAPFKEIVRTMDQWRVSALPVVADGVVTGVVSGADLLPKEEFRGAVPDRHTRLYRPDPEKPTALTAGELMSSPAVTVHGTATLAQAARLMALHRVTRLPVVGLRGRLDGIVSRSDLLTVFLRPDRDIAEEVRRNVVNVLFADQPGPVTVSVEDGVVTLSGQLTDAALAPVAARLVTALRGVVGFENRLAAQPRTAPADTP
jgi:CBS domain-containing protein